MRAIFLLNMFPAVAASCWAAEGVDVKITPTIQEHCHVVRFPQGWSIAPFVRNHDVLNTVTPVEYTYWSDYEFRVPGVLETRFLVRGVNKSLNKGPYNYTKNAYALDLSDPKCIPRPASENEWQSGTVVPDNRLTDFSRNFAKIAVRLTNGTPLRFRGFQFDKTGKVWEGEVARLSPDQSWIALLSSSGKIAKRDGFTGFEGRDKGELFVDVYNAYTGEKLLTIVGTYLNIDPQALNQALWVTERYFILPLGEHRQPCLVCDLGPNRT
ncbi:MAG: hypothetical protein ABSE57_11515 [Bryobacteraceae bacterium]